MPDLPFFAAIAGCAAGVVTSAVLAARLYATRVDLEFVSEEKAALLAERNTVRHLLSAAHEEIYTQARQIATYRAADQKRQDQRIAASHARVAKLAAAKANGARA
jgi:hypothetical protein